ncbi:hypothetical protein [Thiosocius teredinicola]|uniref:hypothetical protein n=1 Tax=Thiosocius teredinicola TaxID=1973002 RepID=UPI000990D113
MTLLGLLEKLLKWLFVASLFGLAIGWWNRDALPDPGFYDKHIEEEPRQAKVEKAPFAVNAGNTAYQIAPLYRYQLDGVVVSMHHADSWWDIYHHDDWQDYLNLKDLCVIWGDNVRSAVYQQMGFDNTTWTCWASWPNSEVGRLFQKDQLSNNHLLADRPEVQAAILAARPGDQVRFSGYLAEYRNPATGFYRKTSTVRTDGGNGACETVYVDRFEVVKQANTGWRRLFDTSKWLAPLSLVGFIGLMAVTPVRRDTHR